MTPAAVQGKILQALGNYLRRDPDTIAVESSLRDDLGLDSMATIELLYRVEEAFDLQIPDEDLQGLGSVRDVAEYVQRRLAPPPARPAKTGTAVKKSKKPRKK